MKPPRIISVMGWLFTIGCLSVIVACVVLVLLIRHYSGDLPDYSTLAKYDPPTVTRLYTKEGQLLAEYATERRVFVPLKAMPKRVVQAFISAEDKNFYSHTGVDYTSIVRALYTNVAHIGQEKGMVGGSTITQQVVKNFLLTNERTFERKMKEAILAMRITGAYSKDKILELYLNQIFLGLRSYGVAAAALNYFNKSLDDLSIEEAALLAAMPKAPSNYDPRKNYEAALDRRNWVIKRMHEDGYISSAEAKAALATPITLKRRDEDETVRADFFAEETRRQLAELYGPEVVKAGGLTVKTTLDNRLQKAADKALQDALIAYDKKRGYRGVVKKLEGQNYPAQLAELEKSVAFLIRSQRLGAVTALDKTSVSLVFADGSQGAIPFSTMKWTRRVLADGVLGPEVRKPADILNIGDVVIAEPNDKHFELAQVPAVNGALVAIEPFTGRVLALSGGYSSGLTDFNRATQAMRQPGSAFKPFVYLAALENGFRPSSIVLDAPITLSQGAGQEAWSPSNYKDEYLGPATLRAGLEKSRNTMTVRLGQAIGIDRVIEMGTRLGIYEKLPRNMSTVLGTAETSVLKLTNAYAMLVNGGKKVAPSLIERVDDRHGKTIFRLDNQRCDSCLTDDVKGLAAAAPPPVIEDAREQVIDPRIAYQMVDMLEGVVKRGTATRAKVLQRPIGGKTGTTNDSKDVWFVGFSSRLVVGLYIGFDTPRTLGKKETGGSLALPGFVEFMQDALKDTPVEAFTLPTGIEQKTITTYAPDSRTPEQIEASSVLTPEAVLSNELVIMSDEPIFKPKSAQVIDEQLPVRKPIDQAPVPSELPSTQPDPQAPFDPTQEDALPWHGDGGSGINSGLY